MSMDYICRTYDVPAKRGGRVRYSGGKEPKLGTITGEHGERLLIRLDGDSKSTGLYHPTWKLEYLEATDAVA